MLQGIDISNWQAGLDLARVMPGFCIIKATEGLDYVDPYCDGFVQDCIKLGIPWGFYHFGTNDQPEVEADFFYNMTQNYFGQGIPVLDWEENQSVDWVNRFVSRVHQLTGIWPWIYANPWRFDQGGVESNCMRWVASYPNVASPTFADAEGWEAPDCDGLVGCWQFCSDGQLAGYNGQLDLDLFYGSKEAWNTYAGIPDNSCGNGSDSPSSNESVLENSEYEVIIRKKNS